MTWLADLLNVGAGLRRERREYRGARRTTKAQLAQMRALVDNALEHQKWPPGAEAGQWVTTWPGVERILSQRMRDEEFERISTAYWFAGQLQRGLEAGERPFDATSQTAGADRHFFERIRASLDDADEALATRRWR